MANVSMANLQWQLDDLRDEQEEFQKRLKDQQTVKKGQEKMKEEVLEAASTQKGQGKKEVPKNAFMALVAAMAMGFNDQLTRMGNQASQMKELEPQMNSLDSQLNSLTGVSIDPNADPTDVMETAQEMSGKMTLLNQQIGVLGMQENQCGQQISTGAGQVQSAASTEDLILAALTRTQKIVK